MTLLIIEDDARAFNADNTGSTNIFLEFNYGSGACRTSLASTSGSGVDRIIIFSKHHLRVGGGEI
jgi:hypothetical protein